MSARRRLFCIVFAHELIVQREVESVRMEKSEEKFFTARVYRCNPNDGQPARYDTYQIELRHPMTVQMVLRHIFRNLDPTLSFRDFECYQGVCTSCMIMVNGKRARACSVMVEPGEDVTLEPLSRHPLIKDLVVSFD
jgi:succinate dehydrogenase/fumarate reductase-like Fe-S protein